MYIQGTLCKDIDKNGFCFNIIPVQQTIPYFLSSQSNVYIERTLTSNKEVKETVIHVYESDQGDENNLTQSTHSKWCFSIGVQKWCFSIGVHPIQCTFAKLLISF